MQLIIIELVCIIVTLVQVINFKVNYFRHYAICLDYITGHYGGVSFPLYEYELIENGAKVVFKNRGTASLYPKKGKRHMVLIHKSNHNKVVGYSEYIFNLTLASLFFICLFSEMFFMKVL